MAFQFTHVEGSINTPELTVYSISYCGYCRRAKEFLHANGFAYRYVFVDQLSPADQFAIKKLIKQPDAEQTLYPVLEIRGQDRIYGFHERVWAQRLAIEDGPGEQAAEEA